MVRAMLILLVMALWLACLAGAVGLPILLAVRVRRDRRPVDVDPARGPVGQGGPPPDYGALVVLLYGYAAAMALGALALSGLLVAPGSIRVGALAWAALPIWSAAMALLVARSLRPPQRVRGSMR